MGQAVCPAIEHLAAESLKSLRSNATSPRFYSLYKPVFFLEVMYNNIVHSLIELTALGSLA